MVVLLLARARARAPCDCVANTYQVADAPAIFAFVDIGYRVIGVGLAVVIAVRLLVRWVRGSVPARAVAFLMPVALLAWALPSSRRRRRTRCRTTKHVGLDTVSLIAIASIPVSFVAGIAHARNMRARVADLMRITREGADRGLWAESLARTLRDASVRVYWWDEERGGYADAAGEPHRPRPRRPPRRPRPAARLVADRHADRAHPARPGAHRQHAPARRRVERIAALGRQRAAPIRDRAHPRAGAAVAQRIVEAGVEARRRIERDLHDGAQQHLVSLGMRLRLAANQARDRGVEPLGVSSTAPS